jgi:putative DNA modification/repair radical SAM protein
MEQLTLVAKKLRTEHRFGGYIHLKTIPGAAEELITEAGLWADRLSVNIELPTEMDLKQLAPEKKKTQIVGAMSGIKDKIEEIKSDRKSGMRPPKFAPAGQSTQMIVGATETPDNEILKTASELYTGQRLRRVYYSAYSPIPHADSLLPGKSPPLVREHRLYQADWLLRFYGFDVNEIVVREDKNLDLEIDPKLAWALQQRGYFPVDVNTASREQLLRVPGIGARNVKRILSIRRHQRLRTDDLKKLRVAWKRAKSFVITEDHNPALSDLDRSDLKQLIAPKEKQLTFFDTFDAALKGEL